MLYPIWIIIHFIFLVHIHVHIYTYIYIYIYMSKLLFEKEQWQTMNSFETWELETTKIVAHSPCCGHGFPIFNAEISLIWELARRICYMKPSHIIYVFQIVCQILQMLIPSNQTWQRKTPRFWSENHRRLQARGPAANHHRSGAVQAMRSLEPVQMGIFPGVLALLQGNYI